MQTVSCDAQDERPYSSSHPKIVHLAHTQMAVSVDSQDAANGKNTLSSAPDLQLDIEQFLVNIVTCLGNRHMRRKMSGRRDLLIVLCKMKALHVKNVVL